MIPTMILLGPDLGAESTVAEPLVKPGDAFAEVGEVSIEGAVLGEVRKRLGRHHGRDLVRGTARSWTNATARKSVETPELFLHTA